MRSHTEIEEHEKMISALRWLYQSYALERAPGFGAARLAALDPNVLVRRAEVERRYGVKVPDDIADLAWLIGRLREQLMTLRWVLDAEAEWEDYGPDEMQGR